MTPPRPSRNDGQPLPALPGRPRRAASWRRAAGPVATIALLIGYQLTVHALIAAARHPLATLFLGLLPFGLVFTVIAFNSGLRIGAALVPLAIAALGWHWQIPLQASFGWIYLVEHVGTQLLLSLLFARTLRHGCTPLITQFALRVHAGVLSPQQRVYTGHATLAWSLFFALDGLISLALFVWAPLPTWSLFANLLTLPLVVAMFVGEYLVRRLALPQAPHVSIAAGVRAFWDNRHATDASATAG